MNYIFRPPNKPSKYTSINSRLDHISVSRRYIAYTALVGAIFSLSQLAAVIARKSLMASEFEVALVTMVRPVASLSALWWARLIEGRDQRRLVFFAGSFGMLALFSGIMLFRIEHLILINLLLFLTVALLRPSENRILQQHVPMSVTGKVFGTGWSIRMGVVALTAALAGFWMEYKPGGYRDVYPLVAIVGFIALGVISSVRTGGDKVNEPLPLNKQFILKPIRDMIALLKRRKDFLRYEIAFSFYGSSFMMTLPIVPVYLVDDLGLGYDTIGLAQGTVANIAMILSFQVLGKVFDRSTPHRMAARVFIMMTLYPLLLISLSFISPEIRHWAIFFTFAYWGVSMSGVMVLWQLSSMRFSRDEDAGVYQSVHVAAVGMRGLFAPMLGYALMTLLGKFPALIIISCMFLTSSLMMVLMRRIDYRHGEGVSLRVEK